MKCALPASGDRDTASRLEKACTNKPGCFFLLIYYPKPKLCLDSSLTKNPSLNSFVLSILYKFVVSLSKKYQSCLLWSLVRSCFCKIPFVWVKSALLFFFSPVKLSYVNLVTRLVKKKKNQQQQPRRVAGKFPSFQQSGAINRFLLKASVL